MEAKPAMALEYSMNFEVEIENSGYFVEESLVSKVSLVPYSRDNILLAIISIWDSFMLHDFMCKVHTLVYLAKEIP